MKTLHFYSAAILFLSSFIILTGCKTTEANYKAAYDQAVAKRDAEDNGMDGTIYDAARRRATTSTVALSEGTMQVKRERVKLQQPQQPNQRPDDYYVLLGQFKQLFNAKSLCQRVREAGYAKAVILMTAEPLYYIGVPADSPDQLKALMDAINERQPVATKAPYPLAFQPVK